MPSIGDVLKDVSSMLTDSHIEGPRAEARLLVARVTNMTVGQVFAREDMDLEDSVVADIRQKALQRASGAPMAHILGSREFWSLPFNVTTATLVPRPDTETLIELALERYQGQEPPSRFLDLGTGTGCIALALLYEFPASVAVATDVSAAALDVAAANARALGLTERIEFVQSSWYENVGGTFELLVSNPPYIPTQDIAHLAPEVRDHDPSLALDGGEDGLSAYRELFAGAADVVSDNGSVIVEFGAGQSSSIDDIALDRGWIRTGQRQDMANITRCAVFSKKRVGIVGGNG